tara:strand:+ start:819 stop:1184 length:366 start_codon:yes stop_codon:yes gene_type:complete
MSGQHNSENFLVSDSLKDIIGPDSLVSTPSSTKDKKTSTITNSLDEVKLIHPDVEDELFFPLFGWSEKSVTVISSVAHLGIFSNPVNSEICFSLFDKQHKIRSTTAIKKDGEWYVTLFLRA